jgi:DMSO/TMAO reductase YedYZ heme-binding membrane subunit
VNLDQVLWLTSRTAALTAFFAIAAAIVTGQALRTSLFDGVVRNRDLASLHGFLTLCWLPLLCIHIGAAVLDSVARLSWLDVVVPFRSSYAALPIGLGTLAFDLLAVIMVTSYLRKQLEPRTWRWLHRMTYLAFAIFFAHALLAGSDFGRPLISAFAWGAVAFVAILTVPRMVYGRLHTSG